MKVFVGGASTPQLSLLARVIGLCAATMLPLCAGPAGASADVPPNCLPPQPLYATTSQSLVVPAPRCADPDGQTVTISVLRGPTSGTLSTPDERGNRRYVANGRGAYDLIVFQASDGVLSVDVTQLIYVRLDCVVRKRTSRGIDDGAADFCRPRRAGEQCGPGRGRRTAGGAGTGDVSHKGWPAVTGILWKVVSMGRGHRSKTGGPENDELLGRHGSDTLSGGAGKDIMWGDWDPRNNNTTQHDTLRGGTGDDWLYSSHGRNALFGGPGTDHISAYYGHGLIDCGPGKHDVARTKLGSSYTIRNCETIGHFCAFGPNGRGGCLKPGERRTTKSRPHR